MSVAISTQDHDLRARIDETQQKLDGLAHDLSTIDAELERLAGAREQYDLVDQACRSLEKLGTLGGAELFWGTDADRSDAARHVYSARKRFDEFHARIVEIEGRRSVVNDRILEEREVLAVLDGDLREVEEEEEERRNEWVIEREVRDLPERIATMPWTRGGEDDRRFRKSLGWSALAALLLALLVPLVKLPLPEPVEVIDVPERMVELIKRERPIPPPQQVREEPKPKPEKPQQKPEEQPKPEAVAKQPPPEKTPSPAPTAPEPEAPRQRAEASGILAFRETFANLADNAPAARLGAAAHATNAGDAATGRPERSMVTTLAPGSSGGINLGSFSRGLGGKGDGSGTQMAAVTTTRVSTDIGPRGGGGDRPYAGAAGVAGRTDEEIQIVFDRYKASLYRLYNRELRKDPTLRGQVVLRLTIEPNGTVSLCELQSTDMNAAELVQQVVDRVRTFDFGAKDVAPITIVYPIDFLPAA